MLRERMKPWGNIAAFCTVCCFAGSNFLFIKFAVREVTPLGVVVMRTSFSMLALSGAMLLLRIYPRLDARAWGGLVIAGLVNVALPQFLVAWGTSRIPTANAAILLSTTPLDTLLVQAILGKERITRHKLLALFCGALGVGCLVGSDLSLGDLRSAHWPSLAGQGALLLAGFCFASSSVAARNMLQGIHPLVQAWGATCVGWLCLLGFFYAFDNLVLPTQPLTYAATAVMGLGAGAISYSCFFYLVHTWGPTRTQLVAFGAPVVAGILAVVVLEEALTWQLLLGASLCFLGVGLFQKTHRQH